MSVVLLDPRFPNMIPVDAVDLLRGDVCYTEEVPIRVRWVIADLGGHTVDESEILVTTDPENETVQFRLEQGETMITAPSLQVHLEPTRELESGEARGGVAPEEKDEETVTHSGGVVDGEIVGTDDHTVAVAGLRRTTRTEVPASVMDEVEDAIAIMARALRQGEWEQAMTHTSLMDYLRAETEELGYIVAQLSELEDGGSGRFGGDGTAPQWLEQELCAELSDVLLQVLFHAEIANRRGAFDIGHVAGAFVAKMRSRAPYLFEEVERQVPRTEQDRLWAAGKEREREEKAERLGEKYHEFVARKDAAPAASGTGSASPSTATAPATSTAPGDTAPGAPATASSTTATTAAATTPEAVSSAPQGASALVEAEKVIREARDLGLKDTDIPTEIRFPMVGLELDSPGEAERRLADAVAAFRARLTSLSSVKSVN